MALLDSSIGSERRPIHPSVYMFLFAPYGIATGYVNVTLGYALTQAGVKLEDVASIVAIGLLPQTWKVLWAPIIDTTLTRKQWYVIATVTTGIGMIATGLIPAENSWLWLFEILVFLFNVTVSFLTMSVDSLIAHAVEDAKRGTAGGWLQAGNLGGLGLGGGAGLWIAQHIQGTWLPAAVLGGVCLACALALPLIAEPAADRSGTSTMDALREVAADVWSVARSRAGFLGMVVLFLPIGTGAAANLFADIAGDWSASADSVALVVGLLSGLISIAGCLAGGYLCDLMDRKWAYSIYGVLLALATAAMAAAPHTEAWYVVFACLYNFITGLSYAAFTAITLEAIGKGAAATKYNLLACLSNMPIAYMTKFDGAVQTHYGSSMMLLAEAGAGIVAILVFAAIVVTTRRPAALSLRPAG